MDPELGSSKSNPRGESELSRRAWAVQLPAPILHGIVAPGAAPQRAQQLLQPVALPDAPCISSRTSCTGFSPGDLESMTRKTRAKDTVRPAPGGSLQETGSWPCWGLCCPEQKHDETEQTQHGCA